VAGSRNRGVREAKGRLITLMDGDDRWHRDHLRRHAEAFRRFPQAGLVINDSRYVDGDRVLGATTLPKVLPNVLESDGSVFLCEWGDALVQKNFIWTTSEVSLPRSVVDAIGYSDPQFRVGSDYDLYIRISARYPIAVIREALTDYRYVPSAASGADAIRPLVCGWEAIAVLAHQSRTATPARRTLMQQVRAEKIREFSRSAYYYGCDHDRAFARRYLWTMFRSSGDWRTGLYWAAMWTPAPVRKMLAPVGGVLARHDSQ